MANQGRDRLRELLEAVLDDGNTTLGEMSSDAFASPFHFSRQLTRDAGEPPMTMRRRVLLERAAWQLARGSSVTDTAWRAGYDSVEGFSRAYARAFGHPPSVAIDRAAGHWLPAPNGVHFHPPTSLWVDSGRDQPVAGGVTEVLLHHDIADITELLGAASGLSAGERDRVRLPGSAPLGWDGPDETIGQLATHLVVTKEIWLASIEGAELPGTEVEDVAELVERHRRVSARWLATVRDIDRRGGWGDRLIDALCEPPESFVLSSVVAHVLTYSAHRRLLLRMMLRQAGATLDEGDPITWFRKASGGNP